jgi:hypothetical protein
MILLHGWKEKLNSQHSAAVIQDSAKKKERVLTFAFSLENRIISSSSCRDRYGSLMDIIWYFLIKVIPSGKASLKSKNKMTKLN